MPTATMYVERLKCILWLLPGSLMLAMITSVVFAAHRMQTGRQLNPAEPSSIELPFHSIVPVSTSPTLSHCSKRLRSLLSFGLAVELGNCSSSWKA